MPSSHIEVAMEELRGRIKGVERDQIGHEGICAIRYETFIKTQSELKEALATQKADIRLDVAEQHAATREDVKRLTKTLNLAISAVLTVLIGVTSWALKSQWDMQQDTTRSLVQISQAQKINADNVADAVRAATPVQVAPPK